MSMNFTAVAAEACGSPTGDNLWPFLPELPSPLLEVSMISLCLPLASALHRSVSRLLSPLWADGGDHIHEQLVLEYAVSILPAVAAGTFVRHAPHVSALLVALLTLVALVNGSVCIFPGDEGKKNKGKREKSARDDDDGDTNEARKGTRSSSRSRPSRAAAVRGLAKRRGRSGANDDDDLNDDNDNDNEIKSSRSRSRSKKSASKSRSRSRGSKKRGSKRGSKGTEDSGDVDDAGPETRVAQRTTPAHHLDPTDAAAQATLRDAISSYRSATVLCTCFIILAVDFRRVFPHCATKSRYNGVSLMDLGSGQYIFLNALYHHHRRHRHAEGKRGGGVGPRAAFARALSASAGLLMVGVVRQVLVALLSYGVDEREYGVDLNFFVILATVRVLAAAGLAIADAVSIPAPALGALIVALHQWVLLLPGVTETLFSDDRGSLLLRNKEGLAQIVGGTGMYLVCTGIGSYMWNEARGDPVLHPHRGKVLAPLAALAAVSMAAAHACAVWVDAPSRRLANASYVLWVVGFSVSLLASFVLAHASTRPARAVVAEAVSRNMLPLFLVSNIAVGVINQVADLARAGPGDAFIIMASYTAVLCTIAVYVEQGIREAFLFVSFGAGKRTSTPRD